jgi:TRAP-type C4-dicarboxylate transport system permease small subunit
MDNIIKKWNQVENFLVGILALCSLCAVFYNIIGRYVIYISPDWIEETVVYMIIWAVYLVGSILAKEKGHVAATLVVEHCPIKVRRIVDIFNAILSLGFCALVLWYGFQIVFQIFANGQRSSTSLRLPLWIPYLAVPVGCTLIGIRYVIRIYRLIFKFQASDVIESHEMSREEG